MIGSLLDITDSKVDQLSASMRLNFSDLARKNILKSTDSIDVQACPGSGKTTLVSTKLILLSKEWPFRDRGICALSHTNVAKDEIIASLYKSRIPEAQSLLQYPHFIGTIQEFVNRHIALPMLRSLGHSNITIDNDEYYEAGLSQLRQSGYFGNRIRGSFNDEGKQRGFLSKSHFLFREGVLIPNPEALPNLWARQNNYDRALSEFSQFKRRLVGQNLFLFRDMYSYALQALHLFPCVSGAIAHRFPFLFIDEMQDTQKYQDELLQVAFTCEGIHAPIIQRFGDPDQAIFHGVGGEEPNDTFNAKTRDEMSFVLDGSHRYLTDIADKIRPFSMNEIALSSVVSQSDADSRKQLHLGHGPFQHTVFLFDDDTRGEVIERFCNLVKAQFSDGRTRANDFVVKVVGAVGADIDPAQDQLRIGHYWPHFHKSKTASKVASETLIETIRHARSWAGKDFKEPYRLVLSGILKFLELANIRDADSRKFQARTLKSYLISKTQWQNFQSLVFEWLSAKFDDSENGWNDYKHRIAEWFDLNPPGDAARLFSEYVPPASEGDHGGVLSQSRLTPQEDNSLVYKDSFRVELSTIHGVKGETHDATLILETKNRAHDIGGMVQFFTQELPNANNRNRNLRDNPHHTPGNAASKRFLRELYVAMSRPKHLLCIAIHKDRLPEESETALIDAGWTIDRLEEPAGEAPSNQC